MSSAASTNGGPSARREQQGQVSCDSGAGLVDVMQMLFACRGPMPVNSATTPRRYGDPASVATQKDGDASSSSSSSSGVSSKSGKDNPSSWSSYKYRPSRSFSKIDDEVLRDLAQEEIDRLRALGVAAPESVRHETVNEYRMPGVVGSIKEPHQMQRALRMPAQPPTMGARRVTSPLFQGSAQAYSELRAAGGEAGPAADFSKSPRDFEPSCVDRVARSNHGRSPAAPAKFLLAALLYPLIAALDALKSRNVGHSPYGDYPLSIEDVAGWLDADPDLVVVAKSLHSKARPTGVELRALQEGQGLFNLLTESKVETLQANALVRRVRAMLEDEAELLSPFMLCVCGVVAGRVAALCPQPSEAEAAALRATVGAEFDTFFHCFLQMLHRRYYQPCSQYGCSQATCRQIIWLTGGSPQSMLLLLPLAKQFVFTRVSRANTGKRRALVAESEKGAVCRAFVDHLPDL